MAWHDLFLAQVVTGSADREGKVLGKVGTYYGNGGSGSKVSKYLGKSYSITGKINLLKRENERRVIGTSRHLSVPSNSLLHPRVKQD
jgi:hypothetical protein